MFFTLETTDPNSNARAGVIQTDHGAIETPVFMPVGTVGSVKGVSPAALHGEIQAQIILGNTYHLYLRPTTEVLNQAGGLHKFNNWNKPILTDSGGYQVFSLAAMRKLKEDGVTFRSHIDGSKLHFTPENVMDTQRLIGADIVMAFDECTHYPSEHKAAKASMEMTHRWMKRCYDRFFSTEPLYDHRQFLFPIVQGSTYADLRKASSEFMTQYITSGVGIGGLSVGEPEETMYEMAGLCCSILPRGVPRYLMGVGTPANLLNNIALGIDMFDCVMPTRNGRNGMLFTTQGIVNIHNKKWQFDFSPLDEGLENESSRSFTKAYLRHLFVANELLGLQIASVQNLAFYCWLMREARAKIKDGTFTAWKDDMLPRVTKRL
ncbi:MAG TPA: tRNA guanosine(34) transglycosylase Tgt [Chitinophagales bacterium]|nr:tRNA guanosine(34) transglycosylase Tgt [Chitinophagales bacterium]